MITQPSGMKLMQTPAEKALSAGIDRAYAIFGPDLAAFFEAVTANIKTGERKGVQLELPLVKQK
jgi:hypothetical protein